MRRNFRPEPLDMSLIPGVHKSTAQSRRRRKRLLWGVLPRSEGVDDSSKRWHKSHDCASRRTSAECGSLESFSGTDESWSPLQSPLQPLQQASHQRPPVWCTGGPVHQCVEACEGDSLDIGYCDSPLDDMLLRKRRWNGLTRDVEAFVDIAKPRRHSM
jgi:hypothetical protein